MRAHSCCCHRGLKDFLHQHAAEIRARVCKYLPSEPVPVETSTVIAVSTALLRMVKGSD